MEIKDRYEVVYKVKGSDELVHFNHITSNVLIPCDMNLWQYGISNARLAARLKAEAWNAEFFLRDPESNEIWHVAV